MSPHGRTLEAPPLALTPDCRYDRLAEAFGGKGYLCHTQEDVCRLGYCRVL